MKLNRRLFVVSGFVMLVSAVTILGINQHMKAEYPKEKAAEQHAEDQSPVQNDAILSVKYENLDELIRHSDHVVSGTVKDVTAFDDYADEYVFRVKEQFKGDTKSKEIMVYETKGTLVVGEPYILFLEVSKGGYIPHPVYTSTFKDSIMNISGETVKHRSRHLEQDMNVEELKKYLHASPEKNEIRTQDISKGLVNIKQGDFPADELMKEADVIARIIPIHFSNRNKYQVEAKLKFEEVYHNATEMDLDGEPSPLYFLPASAKLESEYIAFLQYHQGAFYTVSLDGSLINHDDATKWNSTLDTVRETYMTE